MNEKKMHREALGSIVDDENSSQQNLKISKSLLDVYDRIDNLGENDADLNIAIQSLREDLKFIAEHLEISDDLPSKNV